MHGYGLSYHEIQLQRSQPARRRQLLPDSRGADVTVTNTGNLAGDEVVQLYLQFPAVKGAPLIALRGFERIHLEPGASQKIHFDLKARDLGIVTEDGNPIIAEGDYTLSIGGGQPNTGAPGVTGHFHIDGQYARR
jgi:beta-glucosidase